MTRDAALLPAWWFTAQVGSLATGVAGLAVLAIGGWFDPHQFFRAYLSAWLFFFGLAAGSMALVMIYHVTGGAWGFLVRQFLEAGMRTFPLVAIGFIPIALGTIYLYPWAQFAAGGPKAVPAVSRLLDFQQIYMNGPYFWGRSALYFVSWLALAWSLDGLSRAQDQVAGRRIATWCENVSGPGLVVYGVTLHFAVIDWIMAVEPPFHSTIFGPMVASSQLQSALALVLLTLAGLAGRAPLAERISPKALNDLGNLLLTFVIVWTYMGWFQYMLVWMANMAVDVAWYTRRLHGGWQWLALALVIFGFALPMPLLLFRWVKRSLRALGLFAGLLLVVQLAFMFMLVEPAFAAGGLAAHWMDFVAPLALGGVWAAWYLTAVTRRPLVPLNDPNAALAAHLRETDEWEASWEEELAHE